MDLAPALVAAIDQKLAEVSTHVDSQIGLMQVALGMFGDSHAAIGYTVTMAQQSMSPQTMSVCYAMALLRLARTNERTR